MSVQYVAYEQIDLTKWDACIEGATNGLIYGYSIYLNTMAKQWDALVLNDYEAVMPLPYNKKYGVYYLYQPFFTASLGVFGSAFSAALINDFLKAIPAKFRYWDIYLNKSNRFTLTDFTLYERMNFVLRLDDKYENLYHYFKDNIKRNIKKTVQLNGSVKRNIPLTEIIILAQDQALKFSPVTQDSFDRFSKLYQYYYTHKKAKTYGVYTAKNELVASAVFLFSHNRAYYILVGNHPNGKTMGASHSLLNAFIKDHAGQNLVLDFEGSNLSQLAYFYSSFGAIEENYCGIKLNRLPIWARWLKH